MTRPKFERNKLIAEAAENGMSLTTLGVQYELSRARISKIVQSMGVTARWRICPQCNTTFRIAGRGPHIYCSPKCYRVVYCPPKPQTVCRGCGKSISLSRPKALIGAYCGQKECRRAYHTELRRLAAIGLAAERNHAVLDYYEGLRAHYYQDSP